jgi:hypothetical protein
MAHRQTGDHLKLLAVRDAAVIFTPRHFVRVDREVRASDMVVRADLRAPQAIAGPS